MFHRLSYLCFAVLLHLASTQNSENGATWTSLILRDNSLGPNHSDKAVAIASGRNSFLVAVARTKAGSSGVIPVLYKVAEDGALSWVFQTQAIQGNPFDIAVDANLTSAFLIVSAAAANSPYTVAHVIKYSGLAGAVPSALNTTVVEEVVFTTESVAGNTKLFGCVLDQDSGDLYVTGGTSASLYGDSKGRSDVIVLRLSPSGQVRATIQFGSEVDEFGRAIHIARGSTYVVVAVQKVKENGGTESLMYRLDRETLADTEGPQALISYEATPLYTPMDIATSGPLASEPETITTVVAGSALAIPDRKTDMFYHVFASVRDSRSNVAVYVDGVNENKRNDYAVAIDAGADGNFYSIGYSGPGNNETSNSVALVVISPTGETVYKSGKSPTADFPVQNAAGMASFVTTTQVKVVFIGNSQTGIVSRPTFGIVNAPKERISSFDGFGSEVEGAEADSPATTNTGEDKVTKIGAIPIASGVIAGVVVVMIGGVAVALSKRRSSHADAPEQNAANSASHSRGQTGTLV